MAQHCDFVKPDGTPCRAYAIKGDTRCLTHSENPAAIAKRERARLRGGKHSRAKSLTLIANCKSPTSIEEAEKLAADVLAMAVRGEVSLKDAKAIVQLCKTFSALHKDGALENEVLTLKQARTA